MSISQVETRGKRWQRFEKSMKIKDSDQTVITVMY